MSPEDVERIADEDEGKLPKGWEKTAMIGLPPGKEAVKLRIDRDVLRAFVSSRQAAGHRPK
jgi:uncharacterized protein (DUF4415 family)